MSEGYTFHPSEVYPSDTPEEQSLLQKYFLSGRMANELSQFSEGTGDGAMEITDEEGAKNLLRSYIEEAVADLGNEFPDMDEKNRRETAEKVIMRAFATYSPEGKKADVLVQLLEVSDKTKERLRRALQTGSIENSFLE